MITDNELVNCINSSDLYAKIRANENFTDEWKDAMYISILKLCADVVLMAEEKLLEEIKQSLDKADYMKDATNVAPE